MSGLEFHKTRQRYHLVARLGRFVAKTVQSGDQLTSSRPLPSTRVQGVDFFWAFIAF